MTLVHFVNLYFIIFLCSNMGLFSIHIRFLFFGSYLDTSIDLSPELMEDILRGNKEVVHRSTYPPLTES